MDLAYTVRRSDRARRARIVVGVDGVEIVVPRGMPLRRVEPLVRERRAWIERAVQRLDRSSVGVSRARLEHGGVVPLLGRELGLRLAVDPDRKRPHVRRRGDVLHVRVGEAGTEPVRVAVEAWLRREARARVRPALDEACARAGHTSGPLTIRGQRTRWASCSSSGAMSFNWRLMLAPEEILLYVIEHEVAHLDVPDHSARFWALLERRLPGYRQHERWLRRHGAALRL